MKAFCLLCGDTASEKAGVVVASSPVMQPSVHLRSTLANSNSEPAATAKPTIPIAKPEPATNTPELNFNGQGGIVERSDTVLDFENFGVVEPMSVGDFLDPEGHDSSGKLEVGVMLDPDGYEVSKPVAIGPYLDPEGP